jgi:drug/metabolite transporter (DMT)-like permease
VTAAAFSPSGGSLVLSDRLGTLRLVVGMAPLSDSASRVWTILGNGTAWPAAAPLPGGGSGGNVSVVSRDGALAALLNVTVLSSAVLGVALVTFACPALSNYALFRLPLGLSQTLSSLGPLYAVAVDRVLLARPVSWRCIAATLVALLGVCLALL